ncbi:MAG: hypothetical protein E7554_00390 [Ruminococcaceae bacterium]|nr:hypothetical protein [Oscillospiraceae bacterium]
MFCTQCGKRIDDPKTRFCPGCGSNLHNDRSDELQRNASAAQDDQAPQTIPEPPQPAEQHDVRGSVPLQPDEAQSPERTDTAAGGSGWLNRTFTSIKNMGQKAMLIASACVLVAAIGLVSLVLVLTGGDFRSDSELGDLFRFERIYAGTGYAITDYAGNEAEVLVPAEYKGLPVFKIADFAFSGEMGITSVVIPDSVTTIGTGAFNECISLTSVEIPDSVKSIGVEAFENCRNLTAVEIPGSVTHIGVSAFQHCTSLSSVEFTEGLTHIGSTAFDDCPYLTSFEIPGSVVFIGRDAFDTYRITNNYEIIIN